jgi:glycerol-1-phosphate dehydrogenase [NAD(P)+]
MTIPAHLDPADIAGVSRLVQLHAPQSPLRPIGLRRIDIADDALDRLPEMVEAVRRPGRIVVLGDAVSIQLGADALKPLVADRLAGLGPTEVVLLGTPGAELHADHTAVEAAARATAEAGCVVAVGSGTICDVAKEASRISEAPLVVVQTACSVNAFSDDMAVLLVNGVKRTLPSRWPDALTADLRVIAGAPLAMNRAGVGELLAMFTAPADWRLAAEVGLDSTYDPGVVGLYRDGAAALLEAAPLVGARDAGGLRTLTELMTLSGLAMGIAGRTAPVSGTEHTVSHLLDMAAARSGRPTGLHGAQVGVATLAVAVAWDRVLETLDPERLLDGRETEDAAARLRIEAAFASLDDSGTMAAECWTAYRRKLERWRASTAAIRRLVAGWDDVRTEIRGLLGSPAAIARALLDAGGPATFEQLDPAVNRQTAVWALMNGHLIRDRFTVADLARFGGIWTDAFVGAAIDEAAAWAGS